MSKYVRTRDGKVFAKLTWTMNGEKIIGDIGMYDLYQECDIEKEADTIEELCDEFVLIYKQDQNTKYVCWKDENDDIYYIEHDGDCCSFSSRDLDEYIIYGSIWTDKGLIYVAKMNDKGELELI